MPDIYISKSKDSVKGNTPAKGKKQQNVSRNPLASYRYLPHKVCFESQEQDEKIILLLRQHPIVNLSWIGVTILLSLVPMVLNIFSFFSFLPVSFQVVATLFWYMIVIAIALEGALSWFFNVNIITDQRIIDVDFENLIYKQISDAKLDRIQDVTYIMGGVLRTVLNYGDVLIETAGEMPNFDFKAVPKPAQIAKLLQERRFD